MTRAFLIAGLSIFLALPSRADDPCISGIPVGKRPGPYSFLVATGAQRGQLTCYICEQHEGNKPAAVVFARTPTDQLAKLLSRLDAAGAKDGATSGYRVWMTLLADRADLDGLAKWAQKQGLKNVPVGTYEDADGPPSYKLHKDAELTVLLFAKQKVIANYAFRAGELTNQQIDTIVKAVPQLFEKK